MVIVEIMAHTNTQDRQENGEAEKLDAPKYYSSTCKYVIFNISR